MYNTRVIHTVLILLSLSGIIQSNLIPEELTTESQNTLSCQTEQWTECEAFLERGLNKYSKEYKQLQILKDASRSYRYILPLPTRAAMRGFTELIQVLLNNGVPVKNKYDGLEETMLHNAARKGHDDLVTLLLTQGADINVKDNMGNTPLHVVNWSFQPTTVKLLLDTGAHVNVINNYGETPLNEAVSFISPPDIHLPFISEQELQRVIKYRKQKYINSTKIIELLLEHGADTNIPNYIGRTPLHVAVVICNSSIIQQLIDGGANINAIGFKNQTPLHKATESNNVSVVKYLVKMGADITITDSNNKTPLDIAKQKNFLEIVDILSKESNNVFSNGFPLLS